MTAFMNSDLVALESCKHGDTVTDAYVEISDNTLFIFRLREQALWCQLAKLATQEEMLLDQSKDLLSTVAAIHVETSYMIILTQFL